MLGSGSGEVYPSGTKPSLLPVGASLPPSPKGLMPSIKAGGVAICCWHYEQNHSWHTSSWSGWFSGDRWLSELVWNCARNVVNPLGLMGEGIRSRGPMAFPSLPKPVGT